MSLDMGSIFIVNHPILNLGFWRAKLKQEASAKKAKACLCLFWPLPSVCPSIVSAHISSVYVLLQVLLFSMKSTARHLSVLYWGSPATLHKHCQSVSIGSAAPCFIVGLQLQHDSLKQCHLLISRFLFRWPRRTQFPWPKKTYGQLDAQIRAMIQLVPCFSWFHDPPISP